MKTRAAALTLLLSVVALAHADWPTTQQRIQNPWLFSFGSFTTGQELGSSFSPAFANPNCENDPTLTTDFGFLQALGLELGVGYQIATHPVDLRFSERYQTFGWTNNFGLGSPRSILGVDALFRFNMVYFGPGVGLGYMSAPSGFTFQGAPKQVLSAIVGCDVSRSAFAEARVQTASSERFRAASVSVGLRF